MSVFHNNALIGSGAGTGAAAAAEYVIPKSLRFNSGDSAYLTRTPSSAGNRRTFTFSCWVKRTKDDASPVNLFAAAGNRFRIAFGVGTTAYLQVYDYTGSSFNFSKGSAASFRDFSAWYHVVVAIDTTDSTADDRVKMYVNGSRITDLYTGTNVNPSQNLETHVNSTSNAHYIGYLGDNTNYLDAYLADIHFIDGQALAPTDFAETRSSDGVWVPKEYTGSYGAALNQTATWSNVTTLSGGSTASGKPLSQGFDGSLSTATEGDSNNEYAEIAINATIAAGGVRVYAAVTSSNQLAINLYNGSTEVESITQGSSGAQWYSTSSYAGEITKIRIERIGRPFEWNAVEVNGELLVDAGVTLSHNGFHLNFSDSSTIEALGYDSAPTIPDLDPKKGMDVITYTGTGSTQNIGGLQFEPGLVWTKSRSLSELHILSDSVRGVPKNLYAHLTNAEDTAGYVTALNYDGFTVTGSAPAVNQNNATYVAWVWRAGGPAVSNTNGSINAEVSANTDYGFSIAKYTVGNNTSQTIGHGLTNQTPKFIIVKETNQSNNWQVYHASLGNTKYLYLNSNAAAATNNLWNNTSPTTSVFTIRSGGSANFYDGKTQIAYCWSEVSGFSKFGSYTGGGSTDVTVDCGFKPRFVIGKNADGAFQWYIADSERATSNPFDELLYADTTEAEGTSGAGDHIRFTDTGFVIEGNANTLNQSGSTFIFAAFADRPGNNFDVNNIVTNEGLATNKDNFDVVTYTGNGGSQKIGGEVYSNGVTGYLASLVDAATNLFDGDTSGNMRSGSTNGSGIKFVPATAITGSIELYLRNGDTANSTFSYSLDGGSNFTNLTTTGGGGSYVSIGSQTISTTNGIIVRQTTTSGTNEVNWRAIRVNGTVLLDGNGPGLKFQPDLVWLKGRSYSISHLLYDSVRGFGADKELIPNGTNTEGSASADSTYGYVSTVDSSGFTVEGGSDADNGYTNKTNATYVAWCWKAGGAAVSNTDGSITSSVSANAAYGFSVVTWTGTATAGTIGHGLNGKVPKLIITKRRDSSGDWYSQHASLGATHRIQLNSTSAATSGTSLWNSTSPTGSVFSVGADNEVNASSGTFVAYCFADVPGYQRIGSYSGSGASGNKVALGFRPRWVLIKCSSTSAQEWVIFDTERNPSNPADDYLYANSSAAEASYSNRKLNMLSDGFEFYGSDPAVNNSGDTYIYLAIGDDEIGSDEDCLVDVPNAVTADASATDTTGGYQRGNYATLNPLAISPNSTPTLSNGNLEIERTATTSEWTNCGSTVAVSTGQWYWEIQFTTINGTIARWGVADADDYEFNRSTSGTGLPWLGSSTGTSWSMDVGGNTLHNGSTVNSSYTSTVVVGDVIGVALDCDANTLTFYKNGVSLGTAHSNVTASRLMPAVSLHGGTHNKLAFNFGQMRFKYPMPSGYAALNTTALPAATIPDGSAQFDTKLYTANATARSLTGYKFAPDWLWFKPRVAGSHNLYDAVRGATKGLRAQGNDAEYTDAQTLTSFNSDGFSLGTDSNGYQVNYSNNSMVVWAWNAGANSNKTYTVKVVSDSGNKYRFDDFGTSAVTLDLAEGSTYIFDQSDSSNAGHPIRFGTSANGTDYTTGVTHTGTPGSAGAKTTLVLGTGVSTLYYSCANHSGMGGQINTNSTAGASNFDGTIQATVKANPEAGFSIATCTSPSSGNFSVGHGLNAVPEMVWAKSRGAAGDWHVFHKSISTTTSKYLALNTTAATDTYNYVWGAALPTSSVVGITSSGAVPTSQTCVVYSFAPVAGYSAIGSFTANGSTDGPFVYVGFRIRFLIIKNATDTTHATSYSWVMIDTDRYPDNQSAGNLNPLYANKTAAENLYGTGSGAATGLALDVLSNGFKVRSGNAELNFSGTYIYYAVAENPFSANGGLAR